LRNYRTTESSLAATLIPGDPCSNVI